MSSIVSLVVARATNGVIGVQGRIPWRISADMKHFKAVTMGKPCIMGRKTWDSLPKRPLPGRTNIVLTRNESFCGEGAVVAHRLDEALAFADGTEEIAVIGGADIYVTALPRAHRIYLTEVHAEFDGNVSMPPFDAETWKEVQREDYAPEGPAPSPAYSFVRLERR